MKISELNKKLIAISLTLCMLSGCSEDNTSSEESSSSSSVYVSSTSTSSTTSTEEKVPSISVPATEYPGASSAFEIAAGTTTTLEIIDDPKPSERNDENRLAFTMDNVWSQGNTYTVSVSGALQENGTVTDETTKINGKVYGDLRLEILRDDKIVSSLKINVPKNDIFLILQSTADGVDYGCDLLSSKTLYGSEDYPDIIQLDFFRTNEYEIPQYARYFAVIDGQITELDIYENGSLVSPRGTHPQMRGAGKFIQNLCVKNGSGGYTVIRYEYRFDVAKKQLIRKRVRFTGYND